MRQDYKGPKGTKQKKISLQFHENFPRSLSLTYGRDKDTIQLSAYNFFDVKN